MKVALCLDVMPLCTQLRAMLTFAIELLMLDYHYYVLLV